MDVSKADRIWLGCFMDSEGSFSILRRPAKGKNKIPSFSPQISIVNTDIDLIRKAKKIYPFFHKKREDFLSPKKGRCWRLRLWTLQECLGYCCFIRNHLTSKRKKAVCDLMKEWCLIRLEYRKRTRKGLAREESTYGKELKLRKKIIKLNERHKPKKESGSNRRLE